MSRRTEIESLTIKLRGALTAQALVEAARDANLYPELNKYLWAPNEAVLAAEARLSRAHKLLISINVTIGDGVQTRQYMHVRGESGYMHQRAVLSTPDLAVVKLKQLTEDIARARGRLRAFKDALPADVGADIDAILEKAEQRAKAAADARQSQARPAAAT